ncbi:MAG: amidohydrolase family protein [Pseudomonadales bacterium]
MTPGSILIRNAQCLDLGTSDTWKAKLQDVRIVKDQIAELGKLNAEAGEPVFDAMGCALMPGLQDHHVHLASFAASLESIPCGPPEIESSDALMEQLNQPSDDLGWLRGVSYHESVAGDIDRDWLDSNGPIRPVRIQHRSGRLWILNSLAIEHLAATLDTPSLLPDNGRLFDSDNLMLNLKQDSILPIAEASRRLAAFGVTGINDMTPDNDLATVVWYTGLIARGDLKQHLRLSGTLALSSLSLKKVPGQILEHGNKLTLGELKVHLHESDLPDFDDLCERIRAGHLTDRTIAIHCVTEVELVFALAALEVAGTISGDRIEHASVMPPALLTQIVEAGLGVVTQPNFILERGDVYLADIPAASHGNLYRAQSLLLRSVPLAFGTDLPFGNPDPWVAMKSATQRQTRAGKILGVDEAISPEAAISGFLGELSQPSALRTITKGATADLCLLDCPWKTARRELSSQHVRLTLVAGKLVFERPSS